MQEAGKEAVLVTNPAEGKEQDVSPSPPFIGESLQAREGKGLPGVTQLSGAEKTS